LKSYELKESVINNIRLAAVEDSICSSCMFKRYMQFCDILNFTVTTTEFKILNYITYFAQ